MKKRITCVLAMTLALALLIGSVGVLPSLGEDTHTRPIRGDVNGDGTIDVQDAGKILLYLVGKWNDSWFIEAMDANLDGTINAVDAMRILLYWVGKKPLPSLSPEEPDIRDNIVWITVEDREDLLEYYTVERFSEYGVIAVEEAGFYGYDGKTTLFLTLDVHDKDNVLRVVEQLQERDDVVLAEPEGIVRPDSE